METYLGSGERLPASILLISQVMKAAAILGALWLVGLLPKRLGWAAVGLRPVSPHWLALGAVAGAAFVVTGLLLVKGLVAVIPQWAGFTRPPFAFDAANSGPVIAAFMLAGGWLLLASIFFTVLLVNIFGHGAFYWLLRRYDASLIAPMTLMGPLIGVISGVVLLGDPVSWQLIAGGILAIAGVAVVAARRSTTLPPETVIQKPR